MKYKGLLTHYFETGMEGISYMLQDERGKFDLSWSYWFSKNDKLKNVVLKKDEEILFEGDLTFYCTKDYRIIPKEISEKDFLNYVYSNDVYMEFESEKLIDIFETRILIESGKYELFLKEKEDKLLFIGELDRSFLTKNMYIQMRSKECDSDRFYKNFYITPSKIVSIHQKNNSNYILLMSDGYVYLLKKHLSIMK